MNRSLSVMEEAIADANDAIKSAAISHQKFQRTAEQATAPVASRHLVELQHGGDDDAENDPFGITGRRSLTNTSQNIDIAALAIRRVRGSEEILGRFLGKV